MLAAQLWSTTAQQAIDAAPDLAFAYPAEGFPFYCDCAVILRESRRARLAHRFLDYLLRPGVSARIVEATKTATANRRGEGAAAGSGAHESRAISAGRRIRARRVAADSAGGYPALARPDLDGDQIGLRR